MHIPIYTYFFETLLRRIVAVREENRLRIDLKTTMASVEYDLDVSGGLMPVSISLK